MLKYRRFATCFSLILVVTVLACYFLALHKRGVGSSIVISEEASVVTRVLGWFMGNISKTENYDYAGYLMVPLGVEVQIAKDSPTSISLESIELTNQTSKLRIKVNTAVYAGVIQTGQTIDFCPPLSDVGATLIATMSNRVVLLIPGLVNPLSPPSNEDLRRIRSK
jgi:hypothetical protein